MRGNRVTRRRLLGGVAGGVAASATVGTAGGRQANGLERVRPPDRELTVRPGTRLLFEVTPFDSDDWYGPEWVVDGENEGLSMGPWYSAYLEDQGREFWQHEIDADCEVAAVVDPDDGDRYTTTWEIRTGPDGIAPPTIADVRPPTDETRELVDGTTFDCELDVRDPDENLDRVVWWALAADYVLDVTSVSGGEDTARISPTAEEIVPEGVVAWVVSENGAIVASDRWEFDYPTEGASFEVSNVRTNSAIGGGERLEVDATIRNTGDETESADVELIVGHDPELVDTETVELAPRESTDVRLTFESGQPSGGREVFPGEVTTGDDTAAFTIVVEDDGPVPATFDVTEMTTDSPVGGGETLEVTTTIENVGDETGRTDIELVVGHSPAVEDRELLTLESGESETLTLTFQAGQPTGGRETFPVVVDTGADTETRTVVVEDDEPTPATFTVRGLATNSPVGPGETLTVETTIENVGDETGRTDVELVVGHSPAVEDRELLTLEPGESAALTLTFQAGQPTGGREEFPVEVDTGADAAAETVVVSA